MELKPESNDNEAYVYSLLIVPYGIETNLNSAFILRSLTFNRTLWN